MAKHKHSNAVSHISMRPFLFCRRPLFSLNLRFANNPNLDMDDALSGAATQEFHDVAWTAAGDAWSANLEVNFLKFQKLSFLAIYASREDGQVSIGKLSLSGRS